MRLLYVNYGPQSGVTASVCTAMRRAGVEVVPLDVLAGFMYQRHPGSRLPNARPAVVRAVVEAMRAHGRHWKAYYLHTTFAFDHLSAAAAEAIRRERPDAVLQAGVLFAPGRPSAARYHLYLDHTRAIAERYAPLDGLRPPIPPSAAWRARERAVYRDAEGIFTMSDFVGRSLEDDYGVDPARVHVVGAGPNVQPAEGDLSRDRDRAILFVGKNFVPKGGPELLDAFVRVRREHPGTQLWIVSRDAPSRLPDGATAYGLLARPVLARLYARASVFALPTLREAFGLSFVEAMTFALPVVGTRVEAVPEIVADGETGLLVPPRDPAALARAISWLFSDPIRARRLGEAGRVRALARFGWDRAVAGMLSVIASSPVRAMAGEPLIPAG